MKESTKKFILLHLPNFDFSKERSRGEITSVLNVVFKMEERRVIANRLADIAERGIIPGVVVENPTGEHEVVHSITNTGYLVFKSRRGSFNPKYWNVVE